MFYSFLSPMPSYFPVFFVVTGRCIDKDIVLTGNYKINSSHTFPFRYEHVFYCFNSPRHLSSPPVFIGVRVAPSLVFSVVFCRSLFVLLSFLILPLCCPSFSDLRVVLITSLISSNSSYMCVKGAVVAVIVW